MTKRTPTEKGDYTNLLHLPPHHHCKILGLNYDTFLHNVYLSLVFLAELNVL